MIKFESYFVQYVMNNLWSTMAFLYWLSAASMLGAGMRRRDLIIGNSLFIEDIRRYVAVPISMQLCSFFQRFLRLLNCYRSIVNSKML